MVDHKLRLILIVVSFLFALAGMIALIYTGKAEGEGFGALLAAVGILGPAVLDSGAEQRKRKRASSPPAAAPTASSPPGAP